MSQEFMFQRRSVFELAAAGRSLQAIMDCTGIREPIATALWNEFNSDKRRAAKAEKRRAGRILKMDDGSIRQAEIARRMRLPEKEVQRVLYRAIMGGAA